MFNRSFFETPVGRKELFFAMSSTPDRNFETELAVLLEKYQTMSSGSAPVWMRFHVSDVTNQAEQLRVATAHFNCPVSIVGQPPADGSRLALEAYHITPIPRLACHGSSIEVGLDGYELLYHVGESASGSGSNSQMDGEFQAIERILSDKGGSVAHNLQRTWIYCRDIDNNYAGLVAARKQFFDERNLTEKTHYIASTGIEGCAAEHARLVKMDSFALFDHEPAQIEYMSAPDHLSPTHVYGVTFERGTRIIYADRSHYYISGTASIDREGRTLYPKEVVRQTERLVENVSALLRNHDGSLADLKQAVVYLRDPADRDLVEDVLSELLSPETARITVRGPVCRPGWLVEMEGIAVNNKGDARFKNFQ